MTLGLFMEAAGAFGYGEPLAASKYVSGGPSSTTGSIIAFTTTPPNGALKHQKRRGAEGITMKTKTKRIKKKSLTGIKETHSTVQLAQTVLVLLVGVAFSFVVFFKILDTGKEQAILNKANYEKATAIYEEAHREWSFTRGTFTKIWVVGARPEYIRRAYRHIQSASFAGEVTYSINGATISTSVDIPKMADVTVGKSTALWVKGETVRLIRPSELTKPVPATTIFGRPTAVLGAIICFCMSVWFLAGLGADDPSYLRKKLERHAEYAEDLYYRQKAISREEYNAMMS